MTDQTTGNQHPRTGIANHSGNPRVVATHMPIQALT